MYNLIKHPSGWDDPRVKESHPNKTLLKHISEVKEIYSKLLDYYGYISLKNVNRYKKYFEIVDDVIEYHDMGKLHPRWNIGNKVEVYHSVESVYWVLENSDFFNKKYSDFDLAILNYLILRHHSRLKKSLPHRGLRNRKVEKYFRRLAEKFDFERKIIEMDKEVATIIADLYGLFKIADVASAENIELSLKYPPKISLKDFEHSLSRNIDRERLNEQVNLIGSEDLIILRAYTGWGKTTSSILYTVGKNFNKAFYMLPTITAINKFYESLTKLIGDSYVGRYFYFYDVDVLLAGEFEARLDRMDTLLLEKLFIEYPINITTVDQFILSFLRVGKYHMKRVNFKKSILIFDEVHLLTPFMLELVLRILEEYKELYDFNVLFMSATLPKKLMEYINERLNPHFKRVKWLDYLDGYKRLKRIKFKLIDSSLLDNLHLPVEQFRNGSKVLLIFNRVDNAIKAAYTLVREHGVDYKSIILLHSRYMYRDRRRIEKKIDAKEDIPHIFVSTQVSEVSLDISYDYLHTEIAPISSLVQRFGRVNRRCEKGAFIDNTNVFIYTGLNSSDSGSYRPYTREDIDTSITVLSMLEGNRLKNEYQIIELYDKHYNLEPALEAQGNKNIETLIDFYGYLYSPDLTEEAVKNLLKYRDELTSLALPHPDMIIDDATRLEVEELIEIRESGLKHDLSYKEKELLRAKAKSLLIPVPVYQVDFNGLGGFPIMDIQDRIYHPFFGLSPLEVMDYIN